MRLCAREIAVLFCMRLEFIEKRCVSLVPRVRAGVVACVSVCSSSSLVGRSFFASSPPPSRTS